MDIRERIFDLLDKQGKTAKELSVFIGVKQSSISAWKNEQSYPSSKHIVRISEFLDVSPTYLCTGKDDKGEPVSPGEQEILNAVKHLPEIQKIKLAGAIPFIIAVQQDNETLDPLFILKREKAGVETFGGSTGNGPLPEK